MPFPRTKQKQKDITLQGSAAMVRQYIQHGMNNILYQRGVVPSSDFHQKKYYKLDLFTTHNPQHTDYFNCVLNDIEHFLTAKEVTSVILVLFDKRTKEVLENWEFKVNYEKRESDSASAQAAKDPAVVRDEICAVMRQIIGSATILPLLEKGQVKYEIQARPIPGIPLWPGWTEMTDPQNIENVQKLEFRSFSTSRHAIGTEVLYKGD